VYVDHAAFLDLDETGHKLRHNVWLAAFKQSGRTWAPLWIITAIAWLWKRPKVIVSAATALLLVGVTVTALKLMVQRPRPGHISEELRSRTVAKRFSRSSFPSGDAASAFAMAVVAITVVGSRWRVLPYLVAAVTGLLRAIMFFHYPSDVIAGAMLGLLCGWLSLRIAANVCTRAPPSWSSWKRRPTWLFWTIVLIPIAPTTVEAFARDYEFVYFLTVFGPFIAVLLLLRHARTWLRRLAGRRLGSTAPRQAGNTADVALLALVAALVILPCLGWTTLYDRDEGYYASCAWEMLDRGDPFVPYFSGEPWLEKPPLAYWAMAGSMGLLGKTEFAARLPSALAAIAAMVLVFHLGSRLYTRATGGMAAIVLGTSLLFAGVARMALLDGFLVCSVLVSMIGFWSFLQGATGRGLFLFYLGCGLGGLAKGPLGVVLPVIALAGYVIWTRSWNLLKSMRPLPGILLTLAVVSLWALPANWLTNGELLYELVWIRTLRPVFLPLQGHGGGSLWTYLLLIPAYVPVLFLGFLPWSLLLLIGWNHARWGESWRSRRSAFLAAWVVAQLAVFSLVRTKLVHHVLPIVPPLAIFTAAGMVRLTSSPFAASNKALSWGRRFMVGALLLCSAAIVATPLGARFWRDWPWFVPAGALLGIVAFRANALLRRRNFERAFVGLAAGLSLCFCLLWQVGLPRLEKGKSAQCLSQFLNSHYSKETLASLKLGRQSYREVSIVFYLGRPVEPVRDLSSYLSTASPAAVIIPERKLMDAMIDDNRVPGRVLWKERVWIPEKNRWERLMVLANEPASLAAPAPDRP